MFTRVGIAALCAGLVAWLSVLPAQAEHLRLNAMHETDVSRAVLEVLQRAYGKLGHHISTTIKPSQRSLAASNEGRDDGELLRIAGMERLYPHLKRTQQPVLTITNSVWVTDPAVKVDRIADLKAYRVGIVKGIKGLEQKTVGLQHRYFGQNVPELIRLLSIGRLDAVIANDVYVRYLVKNFYPDGKIRAAGNPLGTFPVYHYLHQSKAYLLPDLDRVLGEMKASGEYDRVVAQAQDAFFRQDMRRFQLEECAKFGC